MYSTKDTILVDRKYFVGIRNITDTCQMRELYSMFQDNVGDLRCLVSLGDGRAFVVFGHPDSAEKAVNKFKNYDFNGQSLKVLRFLDFWKNNPAPLIAKTVQTVDEKPVLNTVMDLKTMSKPYETKCRENPKKDETLDTISISNISSAFFWKVVCLKLSEIGNIQMIKVNDSNEIKSSEIVIKYKCSTSAAKAIKHFDRQTVEGNIIEIKFA
ncbi:uncharacterized protein LOC143910617 isoform X2 [Arctopsyche grandis]